MESKKNIINIQFSGVVSEIVNSSTEKIVKIYVYPGNFDIRMSKDIEISLGKKIEISIDMPVSCLKTIS